MAYIFTDKAYKGQPNFLHLKAFGDKGPIIFTDKAFLQIRASHMPYVAYSQTIRRRGKNIYVAKG